MNTSLTKSKSKHRVGTNSDDDSEKTIRLQVRVRDKKSPQGYIYIPLEFRKQLDWGKGQYLSVKLNKQKDGLEIRGIATVMT